MSEKKCGHNNPFSLRTSHDSITDSSVKEEVCGAETIIHPLVCLLVALTTISQLYEMKRATSERKKE
jgi:hypothetical protein